MFVRGQNFYWDCAKFAFSLIGGGAAGYFTVKGLDSVLSKVATISEVKLAGKLSSMMASDSDSSQKTDDSNLSV